MDTHRGDIRRNIHTAGHTHEGDINTVERYSRSNVHRVE